jgi:uncharacterized membrane protein YgdD (TMEM256/DUF423 family)
MDFRWILRLGALFGGLVVVFGAFAAHALREHLDPGALQTIETGVRYQMYHNLTLVLRAALADQGRRVAAAAVCFAVGIVLFSGRSAGLRSWNCGGWGRSLQSAGLRSWRAGCCWRWRARVTNVDPHRSDSQLFALHAGLWLNAPATVAMGAPAPERPIPAARFPGLAAG